VDRKEMSIIVVIVVVVFLAVTAVTARSSLSSTPLYTVRMEQRSSKMNFLPTPVNEFTYTTEKGYVLNYEVCVGHYCSAAPLGKCTQYSTTCINTCPNTCVNTCPDTCDGYTCDDTSCQNTCEGPTCEWTCGNPTCDPTCEDPWTCMLSSCDMC